MGNFELIGANLTEHRSMVSEANRHARARRRRHFLRLGTRCHQGSQAHQVVCGCGKRDNPVDQCSTTVAQLPQSAHGLHPAKHLLDELPFALTDRAWSTPSLPGSATSQTTSWRISTASRSTSRMPVIRGSNPMAADSLTEIAPPETAVGHPTATARGQRVGQRQHPPRLRRCPRPVRRLTPAN